MQNVPLFKEKNEIRATVSVSNYQAAYSVSDHIGLMVNAQYKKPEWSLTVGNTKFNYESKKTLIEGGAGFFSPFGKSGMFEVYGGAGAGSVSFDRSFSDTSGGPSTVFNRYYAKTTRFFVQPSVGLSHDNVDLAFSTRFVGLQFSDIDTSGYTQFFLIENDLSELGKPFYMFLEPAVTLRAGWKYVKFHLQCLLSAKLNSEPLNYIPFSFNMGMHINIAPRHKKE